MNESKSLLELTTELIDLQAEKKAYNKDINSRIKEIKEQIADKVAEQYRTTQE